MFSFCKVLQQKGDLLLKGVWLQIFVAFAVSLSNISDGMNTGWSGAFIEKLTSNNNSNETVTLGKASLVGTLPMYSSCATIPLVIYSANSIGRKWTIIWGMCFILSGWIIISVTEQIELVFLSSVLRGPGATVIYTISNMYVAEVAEPNVRGFLGCFIAVGMNIGILLSYICISYISLRQLATCSVAISCLTLTLFIWAPESPYFLVMKNKIEDAKHSLQKFRKNTAGLKTEMENIEATVKRNDDEKGSLWEMITDYRSRKALVIVLMVQTIQQTSGIDAILLFIKVILSATNESISNNTASVIFGLIKLLSCMLSLILLDKVGRKPLLIISCSTSAVLLAMLGGYFYMKEVLQYDLSSVTWLPLLFLLLYVTGYNIGLGVVTFILGSEIFPTRFKALGVTVNQLAFCTSMIAVVNIFSCLHLSYGLYMAFWFLALCTLFGLLFVIVFVFETKCKSFNDVLIQL